MKQNYLRTDSANCLRSRDILSLPKCHIGVDYGHRSTGVAYTINGSTPSPLTTVPLQPDSQTTLIHFIAMLARKQRAGGFVFGVPVLPGHILGDICEYSRVARTRRNIAYL